MATLAKIFITIIFVLSSVLLGFAIAAVADRNDNPKYQYMRELRLRQMIKYDIKRLEKNISEEQGSEGSSGKLARAFASLDVRYKTLKEQVEKSDKETQEAIRERNKILATLTDIEKEVSNFVSSMKAFRLSLEAFVRRNSNLIYTYQDTVRQYESLAVEYMRMQLEYQKLSEEHRSISDSLMSAQGESQGLTDTIAFMLSKRPQLERLAIDNGRMLEGEVISAGEAPSGVVMISIGENEGVVIGQRFSVLAGGDFIAKIKVIRTMPNSSIALVQTPYQNVRIRSGNQVRRSLILLRRRSYVERNR